MRAVIDTNVLVSGIFWRGPPHIILGHIRVGGIGLVLSPALLAELAAVIGRSKFQSILDQTGRKRERVLAELAELAEIIDPAPLALPVCRDPDDDKILALARAARVDVIVSGDQDLLSLGSFEAIRIVTPSALLLSGAVV